MRPFSPATLASFAAYASQPVLWPETAQVVQGPITGAFTLRHDQGTVAPFTLSERDLSAVSGELTWRPADPVQLSASWRVLSARDAAGTRITGPGDLQLTTQARLWTLPSQASALWIHWELKLPNAEPPLGTDETDTAVGLWSRTERERLRWDLGAFLWIAGHPHQLNAQDDALLLRARVYVPAGPGEALVATDWRVQSPRNPHDASVRVGWALPLRGPVQVGATGGFGLTPAAPDWQAGLWLGLVPPGDGV